METHIIRINGHRVGYSHAGNGLPIILVHGFPTTSYLYHRMMPLLAEHFAVYAVDLLGYGTSVVRPDVPIHIEAQAGMLGEFAAELNLKPFVLIGHQLGGAVCQLVTINNPEWVRCMVWIDTMMDNNFPTFNLQMLIRMTKLPGSDFVLKRTQLLQSWAYSHVHHGAIDASHLGQDVIDAFLEVPYFHSPEGMERFLRVLNSQDENGRISRRVANGLAEMTTSTLVLWGAQDPIFSHYWPQRLLEEVPGVKAVHYVPNVGHYGPLENPATLTEHICRFVWDNQEQ